MEIGNNGNKFNKLEFSESVDITKYIKLIKREKWKILLITLIIFMIWSIIIIKKAPMPEYGVSAVIRFSTSRDVAKVEEEGSRRSGFLAKVGIIKSRNFLETVVDKLDLQFTLKNIFRRNAVDSLYLEDKFERGNYLVEKKDGNINLRFTNSSQGIENKVVFSMPYSEPVIVTYKGLYLQFKDGYWENRDEVEFNLNSTIRTVDAIRDKFNAKFADRFYSILTLTYGGIDPYLITDVLNTIVVEFEKQNLDINKSYTRKILNVLADQLEVAKTDLDKSEQALKEFRERNPWVGLTADMSTVVSDISSSESSIINLEQKYTELQNLVNEYYSSAGDTKYSALAHIISFLSSEMITTMPAIQEEFSALRGERTRLLSNYSDAHPYVLENQEKLNTLSGKIIELATNHTNKLKSDKEKLQESVLTNNRKMRVLPTLELELAELKRKMSINDQVYSSILIRYNQAKLADAVEVGDAQVVDYASIPVIKSKYSAVIKFLLLGFIIGLGASLAIVLVRAFFDKTARSPKEIEEKLRLKVYTSIPVIGDDTEIPEYIDFEEKNRVDPKLITADYSPTPVGEAYRSLRTQILYLKEKANVSVVMMGSLNPSEGKSLNTANLAITFAQQKLPTLLIDADLRRGVMHHSFACTKKPGLSDILYSKSEINDTTLNRIIQKTHVPNLFLLSSGKNIPNPSEVLGSSAFEHLIAMCRRRFSMIIIDTPPIWVISDAVVISKMVDIAFLVIRSAKTNLEHLKEKLIEYGPLTEKLQGAILNFAEHESLKESYKYSYYNY